MKRREFIRQSAAIAATSVFAGHLNIFHRAGTFTDLRNGIGIFESRGGTIGWMATGDALVVVDSQYPDTAQECLKGLKEKSSRKLDLLINTHHHGDHTAGNEVFVPAAQESVAHENVPILQRASAARSDDARKPVVVKTTYENEWSRKVGNETLHLQYYGPAHTSGDSVVHFVNANIAHLGDLVFNRLPPYLDRSANATVAGWIEVLEAAHKDLDDDTIVISGHGNEAFGVTGSRADLLVMRDYLSALRDYVTAGIREGKSAEDLAMPKLPGFDDHYSEAWQTAVPNGIKAAHEEFSGSDM